MSPRKKAIESEFHPSQRHHLDLEANKIFNLVNLISAAVALVKSAENNERDTEFYTSLIRGTVDYDTAICFAWFHASINDKKSTVSLAYETLDIEQSLAPLHTKCVDQILRKEEP